MCQTCRDDAGLAVHWWLVEVKLVQLTLWPLLCLCTTARIQSCDCSFEGFTEVAPVKWDAKKKTYQT